MTSMSMNERLLHIERQYMELDRCRAEAGKLDPSLSQAIEAVVGTMADLSGGGTAGTGARLRVLERELGQAAPAPSCARLASAARADLSAEPSDADDGTLMAASRKFALHHQLSAGTEDDWEADRHLDAYNRIGGEMAGIPARTVAGAALKLFVDLILEHGCRQGRPFGIHKPDGPPYGEPLAWSAITDLHRLTRHLLPEEFRRDDDAAEDETGGKDHPRNPPISGPTAGPGFGAAVIRPLRTIGSGGDPPEGGPTLHTPDISRHDTGPATGRTDGPRGSWNGPQPIPSTFPTVDQIRDRK